MMMTNGECRSCGTPASVGDDSGLCWECISQPITEAEIRDVYRWGDSWEAYASDLAEAGVE